MNNLKRYLTLAALLSLGGISVAAAAPVTAGEYNLTLRNGAPCTVTLSADGSASAGACANVQVSHWRQTGGTLELDRGSDVYALFHQSTDGYAGHTVATNSSVTLTPTPQTAAAH